MCDMIGVETKGVLYMLKTASNIIRVILSAMAVGMVLIELFWTPNVLSYAGSLGADGVMLTAMNLLSMAITCVSVAVFLLAFRFAHAVEYSTVFSAPVAHRLKLVACLIVSDCVAFGAVAAMLLSLGEGVLAPAMALFDAVGIAIAVMLFLLARYISEAATLKEEAQYTL